MARRSRKKNNNDLIVKVAACIAAAVVPLFVLNLLFSDSPVAEESASESIKADQPASAHVRTSGTIVGTVEEIRTVGNNRVVFVRTKEDAKKIIPLLILKGTEADIFRGKNYAFKYECRSGVLPDAAVQENKLENNSVKGVFIVKEVQSHS